MSTLKFNPDAALDTISEIESIVSKVEESMENLDKIFKITAPGMRVDWADTFRNRWNDYYNESVPEIMDNMKTSAKNLQKGIEVAAQITKG